MDKVQYCPNKVSRHYLHCERTLKIYTKTSNCRGQSQTTLKGWQRIQPDAIEVTPKENELMKLTTQEALE